MAGAQARKLHRWTDLLAALLRRRFPVPLETLLDEVPAYAASQDNKPTLRRMFERDKDELRSFGVPIETITDAAGEVVGYQLRREHFYLPYLSVAGAQGREPRRVDRDGFRSLPQLAFEPDELAAIAQAARRVEALGEPGLAAHAASAVRKLSVDLPMDAAAADDPSHLLNGRVVERELFEALHRALTLRKRVSFDYDAMSSDAATRRTVEPFGIFFLGHHWYLAARAPGEDVVKNFRLNRISSVDVHAAKPAQPDYAIPATFRLREHARSRQAWELGDGEGIIAEVEFAGDGAAAAAARLGKPVGSHPSRRSFCVRRPDAFVRWLLSLAGSAVPVSPREIVDDYRRALDATTALYEDGTR